MRRYLKLYLLFVVGYLPFAAVIVVLEGALYGRWGLSAFDWGYQFGAFSAEFAPWLAITGIPAAAILLTLLDRMARVQSRHQAIRGAAAGFFAVFGAAAALQVAADLLDRRVLQAPLMLFTLPCAFVGGAALFGVVAARLIYGRPFQFGAPAR
jgi:hypothetical protein